MDMQKQKRKEKEREGVFGYDEASPHASVAPSCRQSSNVLLPKIDHRPKVRLGRASESRPAHQRVASPSNNNNICFSS